jgi:GNAT superfamily N-acetyltransferase
VHRRRAGRGGAVRDRELTADRYVLRAASEKDAAACPAIELAASARFAEVGLSVAVGTSLDDVIPLEIARRLAREGSLFVAADGDEIVAFLAAWPLDGMAYIAEVDVLPRHAGHGLGARLIALAEEWARAQGLRGLTLSTFRDVPWNAPYYARLGFAEWPEARERPGHAAVWGRQRNAGLDMAARCFMRRKI